jgi:hypothetical protein
MGRARRAWCHAGAGEGQCAGHRRGKVGFGAECGACLGWAPPPAPPRSFLAERGEFACAARESGTTVGKTLVRFDWLGRTPRLPDQPRVGAPPNRSPGVRAGGLRDSPAANSFAPASDASRIDCRFLLFSPIPPDSLTSSQILSHSPPHALTHSRTHALTHSRTHALTHSRTHALTHFRTSRHSSPGTTSPMNASTARGSKWAPRPAAISAKTRSRGQAGR